MGFGLSSDLVDNSEMRDRVSRSKASSLILE